MTAGEFINKLKASIHEQGYTANCMKIVHVREQPIYGSAQEQAGCIEVILSDKGDNLFTVYIEDNY